MKTPTKENLDTPQLASFRVSLTGFISSINFVSFGARSVTSLQDVQRLNLSPTAPETQRVFCNCMGTICLTQLLGFIVSAASPSLSPIRRTETVSFAARLKRRVIRCVIFGQKERVLQALRLFYASAVNYLHDCLVPFLPYALSGRTVQISALTN